jgi:hypothetical protein
LIFRYKYKKKDCIKKIFALLFYLIFKEKLHLLGKKKERVKYEQSVLAQVGA